MSPAKQPIQGLTEKERLLAALVDLDQCLPVGAQLALPHRLLQSREAVERVLPERAVPGQEALVAALTLWLDQAELGVKFAQQCDQLMQRIIRAVDSRADT